MNGIPTLVKKLIIWLYERYVMEDDIMDMIDEVEYLYLDGDKEEALQAMREKYFTESYGQGVDH